MRLKRLGWGRTVAVCTLLSSACAGEEASEWAPTEQARPASDNPLAAGDPFVAIPKETASDHASRVQALGKTAQALSKGPAEFYLGIKKSALDRKWFLNAFVKAYSDTDSMYSVGAAPMGGDVVSFRIQNDKLFIFRVNEGQVWSDAINPTIIVDAYPIVQGVSAFERLGGSGDYILVNPAEGLNNFVLTPNYSAPDVQQQGGARVDVDLTYLQEFMKLDDGVSFETVVAGRVEGIDLTSGAPIGASLAITATLSFREYKEGRGYTPTPLPPEEYYLRAPAKLVRDQGFEQSDTAIKWNVRRGMRPIEWVITRNAVAMDEQLDIALVDSIKRGVESWNDVFGFQVLTARVAEANESVGRDDRNFLVVDSSLSAGAAFGAPRTNPNTGEIRGASIYLPQSFFASNPFQDDPEVANPQAASLTWNGLTPAETACELSIEQLTRELPGAEDVASLTRQQRMERMLQWVVTHEVGHTLGLRHNFKGSLVSPSSSVMDYLLPYPASEVYTPGAYDREAIAYLYGLSADLPQQPFCTDLHVPYDPTCAAFDAGEDPLRQFWAPTYAQIASLVTSTGSTEAWLLYLDYYAVPMLSFVRAGQPADAAEAWAQVIAPAFAPLPDALRFDPVYAAGADALTRWVLTRLFGDTPAERLGSGLEAAPTFDPSDEVVLTDIVSQLQANLLNVDGVRSFATRRQVIDVLHHLQRVDAHQVLLAARDSLTAEVEGGALDAATESQTRDLLARINAVLSPYYD